MALTVTVSAGVVGLQTPAAHAATTRYGSPVTARSGSPAETWASGRLTEVAPEAAPHDGVQHDGVQADQADTAQRTDKADKSNKTDKADKADAAKAAASDAAKRKPSKAERQRARAIRAVAVAKSKIGSPYRYGGTGPHSFDCSGFVQYAWRKAGVRIPRVSTAQYRRIRTKVSWKNLRPGDLLFFHGKGHVGMYVGKGRMIHSPSSGKRVRIDKLSSWRRASFSGAVRPGL